MSVSALSYCVSFHEKLVSASSMTRDASDMGSRQNATHTAGNASKYPSLRGIKWYQKSFWLFIAQRIMAGYYEAVLALLFVAARGLTRAPTLAVQTKAEGRR